MPMAKESSLFHKRWQAFKKHKPGMVGLSIVSMLIIMAVFADIIAYHDPTIQNLEKKFIPPLGFPDAEWSYLLGTDVLGRDLFSRIVHGARLSLCIGALSVMAGAILGVPLGLCAGYLGGIIDQIIMRLIDVMLAFPSLLLAVCIVAILGPSMENAIIAIGLVTVPVYARVTRASVLSEKSKDYVLADLALGRGHLGILFKGILPNIFGPISVVATLGFGGAVLDAAGLSFLGLGAQPPTPEWGVLITEGKKYIFQAWWMIVFPGLAILAAVMGFNLLGDALRDILDPKSLSR